MRLLRTNITALISGLKRLAHEILTGLLARATPERLRQLIFAATEAHNAKAASWIAFQFQRKRVDEQAPFLLWDKPGSGEQAAPALLLQGPILTQEDFTVETLRWYRRTMPPSQLILSTWDDSPIEQLRAAERLGAMVVTSSKPACPGPQNVNYQIVSTQAGLRAAKNQGIEYVLKHRTDTRLGLRDAGSLVMALARAFPPHDSQLRSRFVVNSFYTRLLWPLHPSDHLVFGHIEDMLDYWQAELIPDKSGVWPGWHDPRASIRDLVQQGWNPESYLLCSYLRKRGLSTEGSLDNWWKVLREMFLVVDNAMLDLFWFKYDYALQRTRYDPLRPHPSEVLGFADWLNILEGKTPSRRYEPQVDRNLLSMEQAEWLTILRDLDAAGQPR